ncbi:UNVERIFIED_CONTAM: hypothetical protein NCL1_39778 [Trichonephila clavipes]
MPVKFQVCRYNSSRDLVLSELRLVLFTVLQLFLRLKTVFHRDDLILGKCKCDLNPNFGVREKLWKINKGKCGICGDAWDLPEPRPNEDGGKYGKGIVVRTYKAGQEFTSTVFIVANHEGYFEFKLCPVKPGVKIDQDCLDQHPVGLADGSGNRYILKRGIKGNLDIKLKLPNGLKCDRCVLQYHWKAGELFFKFNLNLHGIQLDCKLTTHNHLFEWSRGVLKFVYLYQTLTFLKYIYQTMFKVKFSTLKPFRLR